MSYPPGMSRQDLIYVGELMDEDEKCSHFREYGFHDDICSDCLLPWVESRKWAHGFCDGGGDYVKCRKCGVEGV